MTCTTLARSLSRRERLSSHSHPSFQLSSFLSPHSPFLAFPLSTSSPPRCPLHVSRLQQRLNSIAVDITRLAPQRLHPFGLQVGARLLPTLQPTARHHRRPAAPRALPRPSLKHRPRVRHTSRTDPYDAFVIVTIALPEGSLPTAPRPSSLPPYSRARCP
ncbi:hypothetical protein F5148DRAFT_1316273 [Russula earlei]|uniref:Uncharacterized protein n=1 Tax=Russula earlei TaxID=71964 RepID=A0ACC0UIX9_9AGAM|nr:hypothetical protein F5148DRAFT_1316273 [Russula earlei]